MNDSEAVPTDEGSAVAAGAKERRGHVTSIKGIRIEGCKMMERNSKGKWAPNLRVPRWRCRDAMRPAPSRKKWSVNTRPSA